MVTTDDEALMRAAWSYRDHGKDFQTVFEREHPAGFRWQHERFGTNARMTAMQAAIGRVQLGLVGDWHERRKRNAQRIREAASRCSGLRVPEVPDSIEHAWYRCDVFVEPGKLAAGWDRDRIQQAIASKGIPCLTGPCPEIYREAAFRTMGLEPKKRLDTARLLGDTCLMFLVHPTLTEAEIDKTCAVLEETLEEASAS